MKIKRAPAIWQRGVRTAQPRTIEELLERVVVCPSGCWLWAGGDSGTDRERRGSNYGRILRPGTRNAMAAHRYVYETFIGPIPPGMQVDHICGRWHRDPWLGRRCVRPEHLEVVTCAENTARSKAAIVTGGAVVAPRMIYSDPLMEAFDEL